MGRMADARKKARSKGPSTPAPTPERTSGEPTRLSLPASGLAEEILSRPEVKAVPEETTALQTQAVAVPEPDPERAARVHNLSFFSSPVREERKAVEAQ